MTTTTLRATAILKTDLASSTARFRALAEADLTALLSEHRTLLSRVAATHDGWIVKPEGDGFWIAFPSVTAAALAAMSMQEELRLGQPNAGDNRFAMRIVITLGDVLHQEGAMVGDAVVLATRIEAVTPPDEIYVSEAAWLAMNRAEIRTSRVESFTLKGFAEPVTVHRLEQTHRTRVIADQYIVITDVKGFSTLTDTSPSTVVESFLDALLETVTSACRDFGGVVRFNAGDAYCITFPEVTGAIAGAEYVRAAWHTLTTRVGVGCVINIAVHKGTLHAFRSYLYGSDLNVAFNVERVTARITAARGGIFVTSAVQRDLESTPWGSRLTPLRLEPMAALLKDTELFQLQGGTSR